MPRQETVVDVFVSSPGDLKQERRAIEDVIAGWNSAWSKDRGIRLNTLTWRADTYPDLGDDAQDVINRQLEDAYDIFLGLLWARFGTPTKRAASGTEEEFERALARHRADPESIKIMMYFKKAPISPDSDPDQLRLVQKFRRRLQDLGVLYHDFTSSDDLAKLLNIHLSRQIQGWARSSVVKALVPQDEGGDLPVEPIEAAADESDYEDGFLDLVESGTSNFEALTARSTDFAAALKQYGSKTKDYAAELYALPGEPGENIAGRKRVIKKSAAATIELADRVERFIPEFRDTYGIAMDSYGKAAALLIDFNPEDSIQVQDALRTVGELKESLQGSLGQIKSFRESIEKVPRVTTEFNKAKKRVLAALTALETEMEVGVNSSAEVETLMEDVIRKIDAQSKDELPESDVDSETQEETSELGDVDPADNN